MSCGACGADRGLSRIGRAGRICARRLPLAGRTVIERQARLAAARRRRPGHRPRRAAAGGADRRARAAAPRSRARPDRPQRRGGGRSGRPVRPAAAGRRRRVVARGPASPGSPTASDAAVLTVPDGGYGELYERIDAESRWAGARRDRRRDAARDRGDAARLGPAIDPASPHPPGRRAPRRRRGRGRDPRPRRGSRPRSSAGSSPAPTASARQLGRTGCSRRSSASSPRLLMSGGSRPALIGLAAALLTAPGRGLLLARLVLDRPRSSCSSRPRSTASPRGWPRLRMQDGVRQSWWSLSAAALRRRRARPASAYGLAAAHGWGMILLAVDHARLPGRACGRDRGAEDARRVSCSPSARA